MSEVQICNTALRYLGLQTISQLNENRQEARDCKLFYPQARDSVLRAVPWTFAQKRRELTPIEIPADYEGEYLYGYVFPADCLMVRKVYTPSSTVPQKFELYRSPTKERLILTDAYEAVLQYTQDITDTDWFPADFKLALAYLLAAKISIPLKQSAKNEQLMMGRYQQVIAAAEVSDAKEQEPKKEKPNPWIASRSYPYGITSD